MEEASWALHSCHKQCSTSRNGYGLTFIEGALYLEIIWCLWAGLISCGGPCG